MSKVEIRLGSVITLDSEKEADVIEFVQSLTSRHKLGELISHMLRLACEKPEALDDLPKLPSTISVMQRLGCTPTRYDFIQSAAKEIKALKEKTDKSYDMCEKMLVLAQFNKLNNISDTSDNLLLSQFMLRKQLADITEKLGIGDIDHTYCSNQLNRAHTEADDTLEYLINTYSDILSSLKPIMGTVMVGAEPVQVGGNGAVSIGAGAVGAGAIKPKSHSESIVKAVERSPDDVIDFGGADLDDLNNFFGEDD